MWHSSQHIEETLLVNSHVNLSCIVLSEPGLGVVCYLLWACLQLGACWFWYFSWSPATRKNAVCLQIGNLSYQIMKRICWKKKKPNGNAADENERGVLQGVVVFHSFYLKKFIIIVFESGSISGMLSSACCMWCSHLSAARCVTGNGRWRPISAGWPAIYEHWAIAWFCFKDNTRKEERKMHEQEWREGMAGEAESGREANPYSSILTQKGKTIFWLFSCHSFQWAKASPRIRRDH